jgi:murein DD-endopeptidase MepM/ murein hydrolase activator NlpD
MINLRLPLKDIAVTQPFGVNYFDFYQKMGLPYHPGVDFRAYRGCKLYASHGGDVTRSGIFSDGGIGVEIEHQEGWRTFYYHLKEAEVKIGDVVEAGDLIGYCNNTGKYTTADHLHFELRVDGDKINPAGYFNQAYDGAEIGAKDWDKSRCYHRYYRGRPKGGLVNETKILAILGSKKIWPTAEKINALVYGGWDLPTVVNPAMYEIWSQLKKDEYFEKGLRPFN